MAHTQQAKENGLAARLAGDDTVGLPRTAGVDPFYTRQLEAIDRERAAIYQEREAIQREREAIRREREAIENERRRMTVTSGDLGSRAERDAISQERRALNEERVSIEKMREGQKREWDDLVKEKETLERQKRELEMLRLQLAEERIKIDREVQMMANLAVGEIHVMKEALERTGAERNKFDEERKQLRAEVKQLQAMQEQLMNEREDLRSQNESLRKKYDDVLGVKSTAGEAGLEAERDRVEAERREQELADLQLARDTVERDKQEIDKIRVEIENIIKAWEVERDRQARERQQLEAEKGEVNALRMEAERSKRETVELSRQILTLSGLQTFGGATPGGVNILPQPLMAGLGGLGSGVPTLPSLASMNIGSMPQPSVSSTDSISSHLRSLFDTPLKFTPDEHQSTYNLQHQVRGATSLSASPVTTPPQTATQPTSQSTGHKRKRKRGDSLIETPTRHELSLDDTGSADYKKRRTVRPWEERFEELVQFKEKHGHLSVPASGEHASLRIWVNNQKALHTKGQLAAERYAKLNALGFPWWNPKGKGKAKKNEDDDSMLLDVKKEQDQSPEVREQRRKELEEYYGTSLEAFPAIVEKFMTKNSERVIDNAIEWLSLRSASTSEEDPKSSLIGEAGIQPSSGGSSARGAQDKPEGEEEDAERLSRERKEKTALLRRIEGIVGLSEDPLRELLDKGGFHVFSSDVSLRRDDLDWLTQNYEEIKGAFLLSTFSKKANKGKWNQKLLMNEVEKIYASFLGLELKHSNLRTKFLSTLGKAVSEWSYFLPRENFNVWSHAVCLRIAHRSLSRCSSPDERARMLLDRDRFLVDPRPNLGDECAGFGSNPLIKLLNLPYLVDTADSRDSDEASSATSTSTSSPQPTSVGTAEEGVSNLLNNFNLPNFPSYIHKKPFQRRRSNAGGASAMLASFAYQHQQKQSSIAPPSEIIIEEITSGSDGEGDEEKAKEHPRATSSQAQAMVEEIEDEDDVHPPAQTQSSESEQQSSSSVPSDDRNQSFTCQEVMLDLNVEDESPSATTGRATADNVSR